MKKYVSFRFSLILTVFLLGAATLFICSILGAMHAVSVSAAPETYPLIVIDPGHGGEDGGAVGANAALEKDINLQIGLELQKQLEAEGFTVQMTRNTDVALGDSTLPTLAERKRSDIYARTACVQAAGRCILISLHQNHFSEEQYRGAQMFYSSDNPESERLALRLQNAIVSQLQPENKRVCKPADSGIYLLRHVSVPAVLAECGFLSNPEEADDLCDPMYQKQMAQALADGIRDYCDGIT